MISVPAGYHRNNERPPPRLLFSISTHNCQTIRKIMIVRQQDIVVRPWTTPVARGNDRTIIIIDRSFTTYTTTYYSGHIFRLNYYNIQFDIRRI